MAINLVTQFLPYVDEIFTTESKKSLLTNYNRNPASGFTGSRYGTIHDLDATTEEFTLKNDRSFTFAIDKLDNDETARQLAAASALARQVREKVVPEVDAYTYGVMCSNAGTKPAATTLSAENIFDEILNANNALDNAEVPETGRILVVTPDIYTMMKRSKDIIMETDIAVRLPENFGFMLAHPCATVAPTKLEDYKVHEDPPGISGSLVEGRICYDAFVLDNKVKAIYYQEQAAKTK